MKHLFLILLLPLVFLSCDALKGELNVISSFDLTDTLGNTTTLTPDTYDFKLDGKKRSSRLTLKIDLNGHEKKFKFKSPKKYLGDDYVGPVNIKSSRSGQNFDIVGNIGKATEQTPSEVKRVVCTYYGYSLRNNPNPYPYPQPGPRPNTGRMLARVHYIVTTTTFAGEFTNPETDETVADFSSSRKREREVIEARLGACFPM